MKLQCNVCEESPIVEITKEPEFVDQLICCPCCDKQLAYSIGNYIIDGDKLVWRPIDTTYNTQFGGFPVTILD